MIPRLSEVMLMTDVIVKLKDAVVNGDKEAVLQTAKEALDAGMKPIDILENGISEGAKIVGKRFEEMEIFLTNLMISGEAMMAGLEVILPHIQANDIPFKGRVVLGTVKGDIHNIGKNVLKSLLIANGFEVSDLGVDVQTSRFIEEAEHTNADIIAVSALMTTTLGGQKDVIDYLVETGKRHKYIVMVGGGATTQTWADKIGADGFAETAPEAVRLALKLVEDRRN
jgi:corrinoid protein of di/trimethylamine methyltransferase